MGRKPNSPTSTPAVSFSFLQFLPVLLACALAVALPFFPDEKLVRLKLLVLELGVLGLLAAAGVKAIQTKAWTLFSRETKVLMGAVFAWVVIQGVLWSVSPEPVLAKSEFRRVLLAAGTFFAFVMAGFEEDQKRWFFRTWSLAAGFIALYGILQRFGGVGPIAVPQMERVMGTFGNPIFFAAYLVPSLFITAAAIHGENKTPIKGLLVLAALAQITALYYTQTRAAWLALAAGVIVGLVLRFPSAKMRLPVLAGLLVVCGLFVVKTRAVWERDQGHGLIWRDTLRMAKAQPLTGVGLGAFHVNFPSYAQPDLVAKWPKGQFIVNYAHNEYLQQLAEGGLPGLAGFLLVIAAFGWIAFRKSAPDQPPYLPLAVLALLVQNFFSVDMRFSISFALLFLLIGLFAGGDTLPNSFPQEPKGKKGILSVGWVLLLATLIPLVLKPYRAQKQVSSTPGFFDERLVDPLKTIERLEQTVHDGGEMANLEQLAYAYAKEIQTPDGKINQAMALKAVETYEKMLALDPQRASAANNLGNIYFTIGRPEAAISYWEKAIQTQPNFVDARLNLGKVLYIRGDLKESAAQFQKVLELDSQNAEAQVYLKRMVE